MSRPHEHRAKLTIHVLPATAKRIAYLVDKKKREHCTLGRVVDAQFGVRASDNVADAARSRAGEPTSLPNAKAFAATAGSAHRCETKMVEVIDNAATGEHARKERKRMGRSLREVARRLRVSAAYLSDLELGRRNWDDKRLVEFMMVVHGVLPKQ